MLLSAAAPAAAQPIERGLVPITPVGKSLSDPMRRRKPGGDRKPVGGKIP